MKNTKAQVPFPLSLASIAIFFLLWGLAAGRHALLQSNAYDLGLFDQWIWLVSQGIAPFSTMEKGVHILADHGAWALYLAALPYKLFNSVQWLLASQAAALSLTAIPLWLIAKESKLKNNLCWLICGLWWLQPVVFNSNLFDFHPEVWVMPVLASCYLASRANNWSLWFCLLLLLLSCRDGLILVSAGLGIEQLLRKRWLWGISAIGLSISWLAMLSKWLYPLLTGSNSGPKAATGHFSYLGDNIEQIFISLISSPGLLIDNIDWIGGLIYLILIIVSIAPFWTRRSLKILSASIPLIIVNILSESSSQRTLIHHYSLPIAVIAVVGAIEGFSSNFSSRTPWKKLFWAGICWAVLAKPWFFTGPYLSRLNTVNDTYKAINSIDSSSRVTTTSYIVPHLSQRVKINFPQNFKDGTTLDDTDILLLNPKDPGWGSSTALQEELLNKAKRQGWSCRTYGNNLELCRNKQEISEYN